MLRFEVEVYSAAYDGERNMGSESPSSRSRSQRGFFFGAETAEKALAQAEQAGIKQGAGILGGACLRVVGCEPLLEPAEDKRLSFVRIDHGAGNYMGQFGSYSPKTHRRDHTYDCDSLRERPDGSVVIGWPGGCERIISASQVHEKEYLELTPEETRTC